MFSIYDTLLFDLDPLSYRIRNLQRNHAMKGILTMYHSDSQILSFWFRHSNIALTALPDNFGQIIIEFYSSLRRGASTPHTGVNEKGALFLSYYNFAGKEAGCLLVSENICQLTIDLQNRGRHFVILGDLSNIAYIFHFIPKGTSGRELPIN